MRDALRVVRVRRVFHLGVLIRPNQGPAVPRLECGENAPGGVGSWKARGNHSKKSQLGGLLRSVSLVFTWKNGGIPGGVARFRGGGMNASGCGRRNMLRSLRESRAARICLCSMD